MSDSGSNEARREIERRLDARRDLPANSMDQGTARSAVSQDLASMSMIRDSNNRHSAAVAIGDTAARQAAYRDELRRRGPAVLKEAQAAQQLDARQQAAKEDRRSQDLARTLRVGKDQVVEKIQVVDGADRLAYSDTRDNRGWRRPLAAEDAMTTLRSRDRAAAEHGEANASSPKVVRTLETREPAQQAGPAAGRSAPSAPPVATPYAAGKASTNTSVATTTRSTQVQAAPPAAQPAKKAR